MLERAAQRTNTITRQIWRRCRAGKVRSTRPDSSKHVAIHTTRTLYSYSTKKMLKWAYKSHPQRVLQSPCIALAVTPRPRPRFPTPERRRSCVGLAWSCPTPLLHSSFSINVIGKALGEGLLSFIERHAAHALSEGVRSKDNTRLLFALKSSFDDRFAMLRVSIVHLVSVERDGGSSNFVLLSRVP